MVIKYTIVYKSNHYCCLENGSIKREITKPLLFHSDRGIQYASIEFRKLIEKNTLITQSMSRKANCWDNAVAESFFKTLKVELVYHHNFKTTQEAKLAAFEYIEV